MSPRAPDGEDRRTAGTAAAELAARIAERTARIGVVGLGYVGLPLCVEFGRVGFPVVGFDVDAARVAAVGAGESYLSDVSSDDLRGLVRTGRLRATSEYQIFAILDVIVICVQTPFTATKEPDLTYVVTALQDVARHLRRGQLIILQSTTYPGTTEEVALPILSASRLTVGEDFFLAFSPERVDPGNAHFRTRDIPKVVGGVTSTCAELAHDLFAQIVAQVHMVSSARVAEFTKLLENVYRSVNIALVNELAMLCERMEIDVWEVIQAASTKPFGFMPFFPGPGVGGHCIPVDPYYLSWKAKAYDFNAKFTALAAEINENMPYYVAGRVMEAINLRARRSIVGASVLALGVSYKRDVADTRESPALTVLAALHRRGAVVSYHDPLIAQIRLGETVFTSVELTAQALSAADCVLILTDHTPIDYAQVAGHARMIFDTRNATRHMGGQPGKIIYL